MRYTVFAGTNTSSEARLALAALAGRVPLGDGPAIGEYERQFASVAGADHAFSFAAGRMGLYALLDALGVGPGHEVILPAYTCVVVPNAVLYRGARPVYVDIEPRTYNMDVAQIGAKVTPRTRAIIVQHTFGLLADVDEVVRLADAHRLPVIEDCAHALGAARNGRPAGSLATAAFFSSDHTKVIGTGTGGMVTTSDPGLAKRLADIQARTPFLSAGRVRVMLAAFASEVELATPLTYGLGRQLRRALWRAGLKHGFFLDELEVRKPTRYPYPARLSNAHALLGLSQLKRLAGNLAWRRRAADLYEQEVRWYGCLLEPGAGNHAFLRYTFTVQDRAAWERHFASVVEMGTWFTSVTHGRDAGLDAVGYLPGSCPVAEEAAAHTVNLPTHPRLAKPERLRDRLRQALRSTDPRFRLATPSGSPV